MKSAIQPKAETCFFERDPDLSLIRRATAEGVGTLLLMLAATGSGLTVNQFIPESPLFGLIVSVVGTAGALTSLIVAFGSVPGGHFNPLITLLQCLGNERSLKCTAAYLFGQFVGAIAGAFSANAIFGAGVQSKHPVSMTVHLAASEFVAAAALMIVVFAGTRSGRSETGPFAVGAWLAAAIMATPSHCYANPAIVCAALFAGGPIALSRSEYLSMLRPNLRVLYLPLLLSVSSIPSVARIFGWLLGRSCRPASPCHDVGCRWTDYNTEQLRAGGNHEPV